MLVVESPAAYEAQGRRFESGSLQRRVRVSSNLAIAALHNDHDGAVTFATPRSNRPLCALGSPVTTSVLLAAAVTLAVAMHGAAVKPPHRGCAA
jgi:hypothetical protein